MKKILLAFLGILLFASCETDKIYFLRSYVMYYDGMKGIRLEKAQSTIDKVYIKAQTGGESLGDFQSTGWLKRSYDALCEKHNDMNFNRKVTVRKDIGTYTYALGVDFVSIDVTSDSDFDAAHPAGSSLGDLVILNSYSIKPYIDSGYKEYDMRVPMFGYCKRIQGYLSELTVDDLTLMDSGYIGSLKFESQPALSKTHKFTVTMTADDGRVFTASVDMTFE